MGDSKYLINLTEQEREKLESIVSSGRHSALTSVLGGERPESRAEASMTELR